MNKCRDLEPGDVYRVACETLPPEHIDHHYSDLYILKTPESIALLRRLTTRVLLSTFVSQIDGRVWYELPFCYIPFFADPHKVMHE